MISKPINRCHFGDCRTILRALRHAGVQAQTVVTSPPYWGLRDYGVPPSDWPAVTFVPAAGLPAITVPAWTGCLGLEPDPWSFVGHLVAVFRRVREVLAEDGTVWLNLGDGYAQRRGGDPRPGFNSRYVGREYRGKTGVFPLMSRVSAGLKPKDLAGAPWRVALALQADGWYLRQDIIWHKPNPMPESVSDRCTKAHEYVFLLSKAERYRFDPAAIREPASDNTHPRQAGNGYKTPGGWDTSVGEGGHGSFHRKGRERGRKLAPREADGWRVKNNESMNDALAVMPATRNKRSVWTVTSEPFSGAHFSTFPTRLIEPCILAGSRAGDIVLDPFLGSGTTAEVAERLARRWIGIELNAEYRSLQRERVRQPGLAL
ncbi:MAG TPA: site-specific DNA-methyltransferase [Gammaproteobacteria bacterium]|nr:site-specific DNA-methyltransferase [Gammaproteobacteria bacterium]